MSIATAEDESEGNTDYTPIDDGDDTDLRIKYSSDWLKTASFSKAENRRHFA